MDILIKPALLRGEIAAVTSKSEAHRLLICAALADRPTEIIMRTSSADIDATIGCLRALGAKIEPSAQGAVVTPITSPAENALSHCTADCVESGSTLRFLLPVAAALGVRTHFTGSGRLPERPIGALTAQLAAHGVSFSSDCLPFTLSGRMTGGKFKLPGDVSSQFITGLLLALPLCGGGEIALTSPLESASYVDITRAAMREFGVEVTACGSRFIVGGEPYRSPAHIQAGGDWSNAAFFLAAGALGGEVNVTGLDMASPQGDRAVIELLRRFGAEITVNGDNVTARKTGDLHACGIDLTDVPDLLPILAIAAAAAKGKTLFTGGRRLRLKESDRITSTAAMIRSLGGIAEELPDGLAITGSPLTGGAVDSFNDHRIAMSAAIAAIICGGEVTITGAGCAAKSYPAFYEDYNKLGGYAHVVPIR